MDYLWLFRLHMSTDQPYRLLAIESLLFDPDNPTGEYQSLNFDNLQFEGNFLNMVTSITGQINRLCLTLINVQFAAYTMYMLTVLLPNEFKLRDMSMPYYWSNVIDWPKLVRKHYNCNYKDVFEVSKFLGIMFHENELRLLRLVILKLKHDGHLPNTHEKMLRSSSYTTQNGQFRFFKCIGLPFQISRKEIIDSLIEPDKLCMETYDISLIIEHGKFTGRLVLKIPERFAPDMMRKDRMYIGRRYVEIVPIDYCEYNRNKLQEEKLRYDKHRSYPNRTTSRSRSRDKDREGDIMELLEETGVKVRGLPYSFNAWDIEEIFTSYSFIRGSVKLGHRGTSRSGEAIILFPNKGEGVRSLALNGVVVYKRYLELRIVSKEEYYRFK